VAVPLLALDTATAAVTVAVADGAEVLAERTVLDPRRHGELLAPAIAGVLAEARVDRRMLTGVTVGVGPGPFTGLRVGLITARTLAAVLAIPVTGVCTLDVLAYGSRLAGSYAVATDARRREVYWARYDGPRRVAGPHVDRPTAFAGPGPVVGQGAVLYPDCFPDARPPQYPRAADLCRYVAAGRPTRPAEPLYLRRPDATPPGARKPVTAR
jgi:tRNA threonylcarbamoyladenosine biosynthesis protein TsaB